MAPAAVEEKKSRRRCLLPCLACGSQDCESVKWESSGFLSDLV